MGDTGIEWMNRSARRMFGGELGDFVGAPISVVAGDELDHPLRRTDYGDTLDEGQAETFECRVKARDGWGVESVFSALVASTQDATPPASQASALPAIVAMPAFPVAWAATDAGSGIAGVELFALVRPFR